MSATDALVNVIATAHYRERHRRGRDTTPSWDVMKASAQEHYRQTARALLLAAIDAGYGIAPPGTFLSRLSK